MAKLALPWLRWPGLAGGIDKDGSQAPALLDLGFGSVEFGSVTAFPVAGHNPGAAGLVARLAEQDHFAPGRTALGIGLGLPPTASAETLAGEWLAGLAAVYPVADYVSLNLTAAANRRFLLPAHRLSLLAALRAVAAGRERLPGQARCVALAVKVPVDDAEVLLDVLLDSGFEQLTVVLPDTGKRFAALAQLGAAIKRRAGVGVLALVAVGGLRSAADVAAARRAGAHGVQVHRLFVEQGAACLATLGEPVAASALT